MITIMPRNNIRERNDYWTTTEGKRFTVYARTMSPREPRGGYPGNKTTIRVWKQTRVSEGFGGGAFEPCTDDEISKYEHELQEWADFVIYDHPTLGRVTAEKKAFPVTNTLYDTYRSVAPPHTVEIHNFGRHAAALDAVRRFVLNGLTQAEILDLSVEPAPDPDCVDCGGTGSCDSGGDEPHTRFCVQCPCTQSFTVKELLSQLDLLRKERHGVVYFTSAGEEAISCALAPYIELRKKSLETTPGDRYFKRELEAAELLQKACALTGTHTVVLVPRPVPGLVTKS